MRRASIIVLTVAALAATVAWLVSGRQYESAGRIRYVDGQWVSEFRS